MQEIESSITIDAPSKRVWSVLMDFERYPEWNPFVSRIRGQPREGEQLELRLTPPGGMAMSFKPVVVKVEPEHEFRWLGKLLVSGLFDGEHIFELHPEGENRVRFVQRERFGGVLVGPMMFMARKSTQRGFEAMNEALKKRSETSALQDAPAVQ